MSTGSILQNDLVAGLNPFRWRAIRSSVGRLCLLTIAAVLFFLLALLWSDTIWAMSSSVRWTTSRGVLVAACVAIIGLAAWRMQATTNTHIARQLDRSSESGGEVLAGLQLATQTIAPDNDLSRGLAAMATQRAAQKVQSFKPDLITNWSEIKSAAMLLAAALGACALVAVIVPNIAWHQMQRFLYPAIDIPPYTGIEIEIQLEHESVLYGSDAFATALVTHGRVDRMQLVVQTDSGQEQTLPMLAQNQSEFRAVLTRVTEPLNIFARSGASRSVAKRLDVKLTPQILPPEIQVTPPAYTRAAVYRGAIPEKGITGLQGTRVDWEVSSNRPLSSGEIRLKDRDGREEKFPLAPASGPENQMTVVGTMELTKSGTFELNVTDIDGLQSQQSISGSITIVEDRRPIVRITHPRQVSMATPDIKLPVVVLAEDDYGISSLTLYRSLNGSSATPIAGEVDGTARAQARWELPLDGFGLEEGDEIQLFARTEDNDPAGAKGAESPITRIHIISTEHFQEMMIQQKGAESIQAKYQAARRYFEQLDNALREVEEAQKNLEANPDSAEAAKQLQDKLAAAEQAAARAAEQAQKLSKQAMPVDIDQALAKELGQMAQQASEMSEQLGSMQPNAQSGLSSQDQKTIQQMRKAVNGAEENLQKNAIDPLNHMQAMMPLMVAQNAFTQLAQQQRDLAERLKGLEDADPNDPATARRVADLESEQEQLKQRLTELTSEIEQHANALPEHEDTKQLKETALKFAQALRDSEAASEMGSAQENMLANKYPESQKNADRAADILESMLSECNGMGDKACENCKAKFNPGKFGNSMQQLMQMMGMKPGASGMKPGGSPGFGAGFGAGGGYAQRSPGPQNVGMYGSIPMSQPAESSGRGDRQSTGVASSHQIESASGGQGNTEAQARGETAGQSMNSVPANYRAKVSEYFQSINDEINRSEAE